jgi:hypothetical protein
MSMVFALCAEDFLFGVCKGTGVTLTAVPLGKIVAE